MLVVAVFPRIQKVLETFSWGKLLYCEADFSPLPGTKVKNACGEKVGSSDNASDFPSGGTWFKSWPGYQLC
jgi:hypothetical protein